MTLAQANLNQLNICCCCCGESECCGWGGHMELQQKQTPRPLSCSINPLRRERTSQLFFFHISLSFDICTSNSPSRVPPTQKSRETRACHCRFDSPVRLRFVFVSTKAPSTAGSEREPLLTDSCAGENAASSWRPTSRQTGLELLFKLTTGQSNKSCDSCSAIGVNFSSADVEVRLVWDNHA